MDISKRGAGDGRLQSSREQNELGPDFYERYFWLIDDHPSRREEADLELSRERWGDYFEHPANRPGAWDTPYADSGPGAEFTILVSAPADAGAGIFF